MEGAARMGSIHLSALTTSLLVTTNRALWGTPGMAFVVPAALWFTGHLLAGVSPERTLDADLPDQGQHPHGS